MDKLHLLSNQDVATGDAIPDNSYYKADTPSQPWADKASAPPVDMMDVVPGYEGIGASGGCVPPPALDVPQAPSPEGRNRSWQIPSISEDLAKEAFLEYVSSKCCYRSNPAKQMSIMDMQPLNTYRYRLVTFTETRSMDWATEPYNGGIVDGGMGNPPGPWDIAVSFPALFEDGSQDLRLPYTSTVKGCETCLALGRIACTTCTASGFVQCSSCRGLGRVTSAEQQCLRCSGVGRVKCTSCSGMGNRKCGTCKGNRQLVTYLKLTVKWKNNVYESVANKQSGFPAEMLSQVTGDMVFSDIQPLVYPVIGFPDNHINRASNEAVRLHQAQFGSQCRILQQKQTIELIPITRVHYSWKEKTYIYFVYGVEHRIHTDDYPGKCQCCSILTIRKRPQLLTLISVTLQVDNIVLLCLTSRADHKNEKMRASYSSYSPKGEFDPDMLEEGPIAPPPGWLDNVSGYEEVPSDGGCTDKMCPPPPERVPKPENDRSVVVPEVRVPTVSEDMAREALLQFVGKKWRYSRRPARDLIFKHLNPLTVYRVSYRLETFTESRSGSWEFEPYTGQFVDGPQYGTCPPPWDVMAEIPPRFTDHTQKVRVPHSSFVKVGSFVYNEYERVGGVAISGRSLARYGKACCMRPTMKSQRKKLKKPLSFCGLCSSEAHFKCGGPPVLDEQTCVVVPACASVTVVCPQVCHRCHGRGKVRCGHCHGRRSTRCGFCYGSGRSRNKPCSSCHGSGRKRCSICHAKGHRECPSCHGLKYLMHYILLTITWKNHVSEFIPDRIPEFPVKKFGKVSGDPFFVDESVLVYPIVGFPDQDICRESRRITEEHLNRFTSVSRILQQRQSLELVPLTHAFYAYNGKDYNYYVFGIENKVYTSKYPTSCCIL
ncbi:uncharacterized protein LOC125747748 [Brienomyrus brachyistius]|uniref:uncharacterized protein LOC125747748 n=1 Tax=Brienomyrus brachyistius TaxID=42636 RepID=UPI0020B18332|nr:uncharacterized protein LOC125747748 [Brienomyrus brachyistius]